MSFKDPQQPLPIPVAALRLPIILHPRRLLSFRVLADWKKKKTPRRWSAWPLVGERTHNIHILCTHEGAERRAGSLAGCNILGDAISASGHSPGFCRTRERERERQRTAEKQQGTNGARNRSARGGRKAPRQAENRVSLGPVRLLPRCSLNIHFADPSFPIFKTRK